MPSDVGASGFGDVVLVPFPFTDQSATKRRPAVVISTRDYQTRYPDLMLMPITSRQGDEARQEDLIVRDWESAGLLKPSAIKPVIATLEQSLVIRTLGVLGGEDRTQLRTLLSALLGDS